MRENYNWTTDCGPIIGEIKHGMRYKNGDVPAEEYAKDMAAVSLAVDNVRNAVENLASQIAVMDVKVESITELSRGVDALAELVHEHSEAITSNKNEITALSGLVSAFSGIVNTLSESVMNVSAGIAEVRATQQADKTELDGKISTVNTAVVNLTAEARATAGTVNEHESAISENKRDISSVSGRVTGIAGSLSDLSNSVSALSTAVTELRTTEQADKAELNSKISATNTAVSNLTAEFRANAAENESDHTEIRQQISAATEAAYEAKIETGTLSGKISGLETALANLTATVTSADTQMNARITAVDSSVKQAEKDIASLKTFASNISEEVDEANGKIESSNTRMNAFEVSMANLRNQLNNTASQLTDNISVISNDMAVVRRNVESIQENMNTYSAKTDDAIADISRRVQELEGGNDPVSITAFEASPNICERGGTENIVLSWTTTGLVKSQKINGVEVTGNTKTMPNVKNPTQYTLEVTGQSGTKVTKTVSVDFVNHIYWGTSSAGTFTEAVVKGLANTVMSDERTRTFRVSPSDEYIYYAYPKSLGSSELYVSIAPGGFTDPVTVRVDNHSEYTEDYYVYRSVNKLNSGVNIYVI